MNQQDIAKYGQRLDSFLPWRRRSACRKLAENPSAKAIPYLAEALHSHDQEVHTIASAALHSLTDPGAVDALCALWVQGRDREVGRIIAERRYVARQPIEVRVLSALQTNRLEIAGENAATIAPLVAARTDRDPTIAQRATTTLHSLTDPEAIDALCELAIAEPDGPVAAIAKEKDYQPQSISRRCVLFLLTGQLERYFALDFELQYLRAEYQAGDERLRQRISDVIRQSGDTRLIGLFRRRKLASELIAREAEVVIDVYARNQQWSEIFALLFHIPPSNVVATLDVLRKAGWRPQHTVEATLLDELLAIRSTIGAIPAKFPLVAFMLGPVLSKWIEHGHSSEFLQQSPDTLRKTVDHASPPDAIAALTALVTSGKITTSDIEKARTHQHWLVRLACLALCDIDPQSVFSDTSTNGDGGELWIDRLGTVASMIRRRAVSFNPDQLSTLQSAFGGETNQKDGYWVGIRLLEALARHHLRHTIEVDEQMTVEIGETDIEIAIEG